MSEPRLSLSIPQQVSILLTLMGALPFAAGAALAWVGAPAQRPVAISASILYGAVILAFLAGAQWGRLQAQTPPGSLAGLLLSNLVALLAWAFALIDLKAPLSALAGLVICYLVMLGVDGVARRAGRIDAWYWRLRLVITAIVIVCLGLEGLSLI